jgi:hypothetical protein
MGGAADSGGAGAAADGGGGGGRGGLADVAGSGGAPGGLGGAYSAGGTGAVAHVGSGNGGGGGGGWFGGGGGGAGLRGAGGGGGGGGASWVTPLATSASTGQDAGGKPSVTITPAAIAGVGLPPLVHAIVLGALALVILVGLVLLVRGGRRQGTPPGGNGHAGRAPRPVAATAPAANPEQVPAGAAGGNGRAKA